MLWCIVLDYWLPLLDKPFLRVSEKFPVYSKLVLTSKLENYAKRLGSENPELMSLFFEFLCSIRIASYETRAKRKFQNFNLWTPYLFSISFKYLSCSSFCCFNAECKIFTWLSNCSFWIDFSSKIKFIIFVFSSDFAESPSKFDDFSLNLTFFVCSISRREASNSASFKSVRESAGLRCFISFGFSSSVRAEHFNYEKYYIRIKAEPFNAFWRYLFLERVLMELYMKHCLDSKVLLFTFH